MECLKCRGLMIEEWLADELDEAYAWRCVNCGLVMDRMIERNQQDREGAVLTATCNKS